MSVLTPIFLDRRSVRAVALSVLLFGSPAGNGAAMPVMTPTYADAAQFSSVRPGKGPYSKLLLGNKPTSQATSSDGSLHLDAWHVIVNGQRMSVETFVSLLPPDLMAQRVATARPAYDRFIVADNRILLSGLSEGMHWVAEITGHPEGSQGYVSALYFDPTQASGEKSLYALQSDSGPGGNAAGFSSSDTLSALLSVDNVSAHAGFQPARLMEFESGAMVATGIVNASTSQVTRAFPGQLIPSESMPGKAVAIVLPEG